MGIGEERRRGSFNACGNHKMCPVFGGWVGKQSVSQSVRQPVSERRRGERRRMK